ncbi:unnamed protein product [Kuraishia capsulata CBS 1993]|uniref:Cytochrome c oxidase assembly protein COX16, mitochondrial n=1 Tax=Kuraishia capsulata CBS 1993 TaxID=1382522 RepID=W6MMM8_9ASCO|nr:uncharacterized protein KUCA_T00002178001 [Kuraishia capsulata CBS 1993]CDK26207.1 unnamed protein product [Kuraishia capsulata CBS 1993]
MSFQSKKFRSKAQQAAFEKTFVGRYQRLVKKNSFLFLGIPMIGSVALGSVLLSNFTAIRYEQRDAKVKELDEEESLAIANQKRRKVDLKEEYYKLQGLAEENENWEPVRVERLKGESENVW